MTRSPGAARRSPRALQRRRRARSPHGAASALAVVSAADPVDRATGRLVHLPDAPFLLGELDPPAVLAELVDGPVIVDNDVNWAARAERDAAAGALATSSTCTSARASAARSSATARSAAATPASPARSPTC